MKDEKLAELRLVVPKDMGRIWTFRNGGESGCDAVVCEASL